MGSPVRTSDTAFAECGFKRPEHLRGLLIFLQLTAVGQASCSDQQEREQEAEKHVMRELSPSSKGDQRPWDAADARKELLLPDPELHIHNIPKGRVKEGRSTGWKVLGPVVHSHNPPLP